MASACNPFRNVKQLPPDAIFHMAAAAKAAPEPKADLIIGAYRDAEGLPYPLPVVRKAEKILLQQHLDYEYLPITGYPKFITEALKVMYGPVYDPERMVGIQTLSGTGAVHVGAEFLGVVTDRATTAVYISDPTWVNHRSIFEFAGFANVRTYRYYDSKTKGYDFTGMKEDITAAPEGSIFVLHQCAHNPTGVDPTHAQWDELADLFIAKQHIVFFDSAYQGYASGSLDEDAYACRAFYKKKIAFLLAQSFSKNMGLYNGRAGTLSVVVDNKATGEAVISQLARIARVCYSNPPAHAARIAATILSDPNLRSDWNEELKTMSTRIKHMRTMLRDELERLGTPGTWDHITSQIGMFSYLGLTPEQCRACQDRRVFINNSGRANMAGLTEKTVPFMAKVISEVVRDGNSKL